MNIKHGPPFFMTLFKGNINLWSLKALIHLMHIYIIPYGWDQGGEGWHQVYHSTFAHEKYIYVCVLFKRKLLKNVTCYVVFKLTSNFQECDYCVRSYLLSPAVWSLYRSFPYKLYKLCHFSHKSKKFQFDFPARQNTVIKDWILFCPGQVLLSSNLQKYTKNVIGYL